MKQRTCAVLLRCLVKIWNPGTSSILSLHNHKLYAISLGFFCDASTQRGSLLRTRKVNNTWFYIFYNLKSVACLCIPLANTLQNHHSGFSASSPALFMLLAVRDGLNSLTPFSKHHSPSCTPRRSDFDLWTNRRNVLTAFFSASVCRSKSQRATPKLETWEDLKLFSRCEH